MDWLYLIGFILLGFGGMEVVSYCVHRWLFHGVLWKIHESHHKPSHGLFELNDIFSLFFAGVSIWLMVDGAQAMFTAPGFGLGAGIAVYGILLTSSSMIYSLTNVLCPSAVTVRS